MSFKTPKVFISINIIRITSHLPSNYWIENCYLKVVISKSGLAVSVPKNANISGTERDMKILKLGFCRGELRLFRGKKFWSTSVDQTCGNFDWR